MKQKLVSIIIPTYNRAYSVVDAIRSVQNQTYPAIQIIIIDDGSQDNTAEIVSQFKNVEYYYQENKGQGAARNSGLKYAKGEYIASLDSDDIWNPEFLSEGVRYLEKNNLDLVILNWTNSNGRESTIDSWTRSGKFNNFNIVEKERGWLNIDSSQLRHLFLVGCLGPTSSLLMLRSSTKPWNEMIAADDWFLILDMVVSKPCRAALTLSPFWLKRIFNDNIHDGRDVIEVTENAVHDDKIFEKHLHSHLTTNEKHILRKRAALNLFNLGRLKWQRDGISKSAFNNIVKAFALAPVGVSYYILERLREKLRYEVKRSEG